MKALIHTNRDTNYGLEIRDDYPKPIPDQDEILIRVRMAGICRTDLEITKGYMNYQGILGHEFVGEIEQALGDWPPGTRVVGEINAACGICDLCQQGLGRHCMQRTVLGIHRRDGCMAQWLTLPIKNIIPIPDSLPDQYAVFTEPLAATLEIFEQVRIQPTDRVCILGDGKLGLLTGMVFAHRHEGDVLLIGHHSDKIQTIQDRLPTMLESAIPESFSKTWDVIVEATGTSSGLKQAMNLVRPRGTIILKSTMANPDPIDLTPIVIDEIHIVGSRCGRFAPAVSLLARGSLPIERLIDSVYPFDQVLDAWQQAQKSSAKKVLLKIA